MHEIENSAPVNKMEFIDNELKCKSESYQQMHAAKQEFVCTLCDQHFASKQECDRHVNIHKEVSDFHLPATCGRHHEDGSEAKLPIYIYLIIHTNTIEGLWAILVI